MVQCDACQCWQHTDCVAVNVDPSKLEEFTCKVCSGEKPNLDIPLVPQPEHASPGELHYVSMAREDNLHVTLGMTVYVLRAFKERHSDGKISLSKLFFTFSLPRRLKRWQWDVPGQNHDWTWRDSSQGDQPDQGSVKAGRLSPLRPVPHLPDHRPHSGQYQRHGHLPSGTPLGQRGRAQVCLRLPLPPSPRNLPRALPTFL